MSLWRFVLMCIAGLALASCGEPAGRAQSVEREAGEVRIAALSPALGIILRDLGAQDRVVARHGFDMALDRSLPVGGDQTGVDYETLLRVRPTHVLLEWGTRELPPRLLTLAAERGWSVRSLPMLTLREIRSATLALGAISGKEESAAGLASRMDEAWSAHEGVRARAGRVLTLYSVRPASAAGPGSFHAQVIEGIGATPVPATGAPFIMLDSEDLRRLEADTIVVLAPGSDANRVSEFVGPLRELGLRSAIADRVIVDTHVENQTPSTSMVGLAERLRDALLTLPPVMKDDAP